MSQNIKNKDKYMDIKQIVGKKIQIYRKLNNLTQEQLAEMINLETISLSRIETGKNYPTSENLAKISNVLQIQPYELFIPETVKSNKQIIDEIYKQIEIVKSDKKKLVTINKVVKAIIEQ